jgi:hypothetical protein
MSNFAEMLQGVPEGSPEFEKISKQINKAWFNDAKTSAGRDKLSGLHESQFASYLREHSAMAKILVPQDIDPSECEVGVDTDSLYVRLHFTPETNAYLGSFGAGPPERREVFIDRIFASFMMLTTPTYVFNEYRMMAYPFPVPKQVEDSIGMDMHEARDFIEFRSLEETIQAGAATYNNVLKGENVATPLTGATDRVDFHQDDLVRMMKYFAGKRDRMEKVLIPETDFLTILTFDASIFGDTLRGEVVTNGYKLSQWMGMELIRTIKIDNDNGDVFREGNIYGFADPEKIGRSYNLQGLKMNLERKRQFLEMDARMACGHIWAVGKRVCKLELYDTGLTPTGGAIPGVTTGDSDLFWDDVELVTERDYHNVGLNLQRPYLEFA